MSQLLFFFSGSLIQKKSILRMSKIICAVLFVFFCFVCNAKDKYYTNKTAFTYGMHTCYTNPQLKPKGISLGIEKNLKKISLSFLVDYSWYRSANLLHSNTLLPNTESSYYYKYKFKWINFSSTIDRVFYYGPSSQFSLGINILGITSLSSIKTIKTIPDNKEYNLNVTNKPRFHIYGGLKFTYTFFAFKNLGVNFAISENLGNCPGKSINHFIQVSSGVVYSINRK